MSRKTVKTKKREIKPKNYKNSILIDNLKFH